MISEDGSGFIDDDIIYLRQGPEIGCKSLLGFDDDRSLEFADRIFEHAIMVDDEFGCFCGCFGWGVGHQIGDGLVFLVADAGDDRDWKFGDGLADTIVVEDEKVGLCAAAAYDDDGVVWFCAGEHIDQPGQELLCVVLALNDGEIVIDGKAVAEWVVFQGVMEVLPAGGCLRRNDGYILNYPVEG